MKIKTESWCLFGVYLVFIWCFFIRINTKNYKIIPNEKTTKPHNRAIMTLYKTTTDEFFRIGSVEVTGSIPVISSKRMA